jgi:hypothetical protein
MTRPTRPTRPDGAPGRPGAGATDAGSDQGGAQPAAVAQARTLARAVARAIATDGARVYFGDATDDGVFAVAKRGGEPERIARRAPVRGALARDDEHLAWIGSPGDAALRVSTAGGTTTTLRDRGLFRDVAAVGGDVVVTEAEGAGGAVLRVTGATATRLATLEAPPRGLALEGDDAFVIAGEKLLRVPRARGTVTMLAAASSMASPVATYDRVYVVAAALAGEHVVLGIPRDGGQPSPVARQVRPRSPLAIHRGILYVLDGERPRLRAITLATGESRVLAEHEALASGAAIAADDDGVFIATDEAGLVLAVDG